MLPKVCLNISFEAKSKKQLMLFGKNKSGMARIAEIISVNITVERQSLQISLYRYNPIKLEAIVKIAL